MKKLRVQFTIMTFAMGLIAAAVIVSAVPEEVQALIPTTTTNQISDGAITTTKLANSAVTTPKLADHSVISTKMAGVTKLIFASCDINFGSINPHADGLADCAVPGIVAGDNVVATPNNGLFDAMSFYAAITLDGKVRFLVRNNVDVKLLPISTTWSVIVFHK